MEKLLTKNELFRAQCYIDGKWLNAANGSTRDVVNPATGKVLGSVPKMTVGDTRQAIAAADRALAAWRD